VIEQIKVVVWRFDDWRSGAIGGFAGSNFLFSYTLLDGLEYPSPINSDESILGAILKPCFRPSNGFVRQLSLVMYCLPKPHDEEQEDHSCRTNDWFKYASSGVQKQFGFE